MIDLLKLAIVALDSWFFVFVGFVFVDLINRGSCIIFIIRGCRIRKYGDLIKGFENS